MGHGNSDRLFITHSEHSGVFGEGHSASSGARKKIGAAAGGFARLPFDCCALTLKPFETPVCNADGTVYDLLSVIPFIRLHGTDPVTGKKLTTGELIKLTFYKNNDGDFHDPITNKVFNEHTHLVAVKTASSANVYSRESIDRLNIKPNSMRDLMSDEVFTKTDIITIQDPLNISGRDLSKFDYVKRELKIEGVTEGGSLSNINLAASGSGVSKLLKGIAKPAQVKPIILPAAVPHNISTVSSGRTAASFTSTALSVQTGIEHALWDEEDLMFEIIQKKKESAFVRLVTNFGNLNLELFCDRAPRTCYNFIQLAIADKYANTVFHRLIPGFMLQGGDPTGTGKGGKSHWGGYFDDEFNLRNAHKHTERGIVSMANSGSNTNGSQFFITFRETDHLDGKHTVFGRIVGGEDVLAKIERVPISSTDRPLKDVILKDVEIFVNPYQNYQENLEKRILREGEDRVNAVAKAQKKEDAKKDRTTWLGGNLGALVDARAPVKEEIIVKKGIGKYMASEKRELESAGSASEAKKKRKGGAGFGDFSGW